MTLRKKILNDIATGQFISGDALAKCYGVSRAAINQHIQALKGNGLEIHAVRGRGYRLSQPIVLLDGDKISLATDRVVEVLDSIDSTNDEIKRRLADAVVSPDYLLAEMQNRGRGRQGKTWLAAPYQSILATRCWRHDCINQDVSGLSLVVGIAVMRVLRARGISSCGLKWPNDVLVDDAKLGGILIEMSGELDGVVDIVIGFGLNVSLPVSLRKLCDRKITDLQSHSSEQIDRNELMVELIHSLDGVLSEFSRGGFSRFAQEWQDYHYYQFKTIQIQQPNRSIEGVAMGVDGRGALIVKSTAGDMIHITTGEVFAL